MKTIAMILVALMAPPLQETRNAGEQFKDALGKAKESKRKVFLTFGSPG